MNRSFIVVLTGLATVLWTFWIGVTPIVSSDPRWYKLVGAPTPAPLDRARGWTLPPSAGTSGWRCSVDLPLFRQHFFRPDSELVARLEADLSHFLPFAEQTPAGHYTALQRPQLSAYFRQYLGVKFANGDSLVIINAFVSLDGMGSSKPTAYWDRRLVDVCDGGAGFWHLEYDPAHRRFRRFTFNGFA